MLKLLNTEKQKLELDNISLHQKLKYSIINKINKEDILNDPLLKLKNWQRANLKKNIVNHIIKLTMMIKLTSYIYYLI